MSENMFCICFSTYKKKKIKVIDVGRCGGVSVAGLLLFIVSHVLVVFCEFVAEAALSGVVNGDVAVSVFCFVTNCVLVGVKKSNRLCEIKFFTTKGISKLHSANSIIIIHGKVFHICEHV